MKINEKYTTILEWATAYRKIGWNVIPLYNNTKVPTVAWRELESRFSTDKEFNTWFNNPSVTGLGVICGKVSGLVVVDEDSYKEGGMKFDLVSPVRSETASGGVHHFFKYSEPVKTTGLKDKVFIEIKSDGGFIVLPPSKVINKQGELGLYKWVEASVKMDQLPTITEAQLEPYKLNSQSDKVDLVSKVNAPIGTQHNNLRDITNSILNRFNPNEWQTIAYPMIRKMADDFNPPHPTERVEKMIENCSRFILENPKTITTNKTGKQISQPLSLSTIGSRRNEDRELEKDAPSTGYPELDHLVKGFLPKHFWTITGETNVGKTAFACNLAENVRRQKKRVLYVALEPEYKVVDYLASVRLNKSYDQLTNEEMTFDDGYIEVLTLSEVPTYKDLIAVLKDSSRYDLIIVDHIGYFCRSEEQSFLIEQAQTIRDLVAISKEVQTCVIAIAHPRKPSSTQKNRILNLYDISGTATFAQDSTEVLALYRPPTDTDDPLCVELSTAGVLLVLKTKAGGNGSVRMDFAPDKALITTQEQTLNKNGVVIKGDQVFI